MTEQITWTEFPNQQAFSKTEHTGTPAEFLARLRTVGRFADKKQCPWVKLATFGDQRSIKKCVRTNANMLAVFGVEGDYDAKPDSDGNLISMERARDILKAHNIRALLYPSGSNKADKPRWRVLALLSRPCTPGERGGLVARINGVLGGVLADESFTCSQSYYFGDVGTNDYRVIQTFDDNAGQWIDLLPELDTGAIFKRTGGTVADLPSDEKMAANWDDVSTGEHLHGPLTSMSSHFAKRLLDAGTITRILRAAMEGSERRDEYWDDCYADIPRMVQSAVTKYGADGLPDMSALFGDTFDADTGELLAAESASTEPRDVCLGDLGTFSPQPPKFWVEELIPADVVTLLGAHGGTGKTTLALYGAVCFAMGLPFLGKHSKPAKVLFYSAEDDGAMLRWRLSCVCQRLDVDPAVLSQRLTVVDASECDSVLFAEVSRGGVRSGSTTPAFQRLIDRLAACGAQILILDNASDVYGADENNRGQVRAFIRLLARLVRPRHGAVLLLAHVDKLTARTGGTQGYSGSTAWHNSVRSRLFLSEDANGGLLLEHQKSNRGKKAEPLNLVWHDGLPTLVTDMLATAHPATESAARTQVLNLLREFYERGEFISTSATANNNAYAMLHSERMFPKIKRGAFWQLLRDAERDGLIYRETYRNASRRESERWCVRGPAYVCALPPITPAHAGAASAPNVLAIDHAPAYHASTASANDDELGDLFG